MYQNDYIIAFDENGKPYIAHSAVGNAVNRVASAVKNARGDRQNHKYILKIDENGRKRYFYTQDEVKAYYEEKKKQAAGVVDKAKEGVKNAANNTISNAKNQFERMKSEFRDKAEQAGNAAKSAASKVADKAKDISGYDEKERLNQALDDVRKASDTYVKADKAMREATKNGETDSNGNKWYKTQEEAERASDAELAAIRAKNEIHNKLNDAEGARSRYNNTPLGKAENAKESAQELIDRARTAAKDASEDLSAKAKSTAQSAKDSVQGMIDNARSSTAKAVNEAWDKIPKNSDGTVNPFDSNFQSAYNDWKSKKDKYDGSLTGQAKAAAEKATDSVKDMVDRARTATKDAAAKAKDSIDVDEAKADIRDTVNRVSTAISNATGNKGSGKVYTEIPGLEKLMSGSDFKKAFKKTGDRNSSIVYAIMQKSPEDRTEREKQFLDELFD